eukprot:320378_1
MSTKTGFQKRFCEKKVKKNLVDGYIRQEYVNNQDVPLVLQWLITFYLSIFDPLRECIGGFKKTIGDKTPKILKLYSPSYVRFVNSIRIDYSNDCNKIFTWQWNVSNDKTISDKTWSPFPAIKIWFQSYYAVYSPWICYSFGGTTNDLMLCTKRKPEFSDKDEVTLEFNMKQRTLKLWIKKKNGKQCFYSISDMNVNNKIFKMYFGIGKPGWGIKMIDCTIDINKI